MNYKHEEQLTQLTADHLDTGNHEPIFEVTEVYRKAKAFDEIKECLHAAQSSIDRSENRKEERDHAVAFFNTLVEMDILGVYERDNKDE